MYILDDYFDELLLYIKIKDISFIQITLHQIYSIFKEYYGKVDMKIYNKYLSKLLYLEYKLNNIFMDEVHTGLSLDDIRNMKIEQYDFPSSKNLLSDIVLLTRKMLIKNLRHYRKENLSKDCFDDIDLTNMCLNASYYVKDLCKEYGFDCEVVTLTSGFLPDDCETMASGFHCFCIVSIDFKRYIVDPTYKQFFSLNKNNFNRLGVVGLSGCYPGVFMFDDKERRDTAQRIIRYGFIELNHFTFKEYMDGFAMSYRNGLYYDNMDIVEYNTDYRFSNYRDFIFEIDNQVNHENREWFGKQLRPLKDVRKIF